MRVSELTDYQLIELYRRWSEDNWCAGFMDPSPGVVADFLRDLEGMLLTDPTDGTRTDYEQQFLDEVRRQRLAKQGA